MKSKIIAFKEITIGEDAFNVELIDNNSSAWSGTICKIYVPSGLPFFKWKKVYQTEIIGMRISLIEIVKEAIFRYLYEKEINQKMLEQLEQY